MMGDIRHFLRDLGKQRHDDALTVAQHLLFRPSLYQEVLDEDPALHERLENLRKEVWLRVVQRYISLLDQNDPPLPARLLHYADSAIRRAKECGVDTAPEKARIEALVAGKNLHRSRHARWESSGQARPQRPPKPNGKLVG